MEGCCVKSLCEDNEVMYRLSVYLLKELLKQNLISKNEFCDIDKENRKSFKPRGFGV